MELMLNSIALEPNRWTREKIPHFALKNLLAPINDAGFDAVEVWQNHLALLDSRAVQELKEAAEDSGVDFPAVGIYPAFHLDPPGRDEERSRILSIAAKAAEIGAKVLKMMPGTIPSAELDPELKRKSEVFVSELLEATGTYGLTFTLETHDGTLADDTDALQSFINSLGSERLKVCWQPYDFRHTGKAIALFDELSEHIIHLHLQGRKSGEMELLEHADIDYARVLQHIKATGFDGYASIEFVRDCVSESPESFDLSRVLSNAARDREFVESHV